MANFRSILEPYLDVSIENLIQEPEAKDYSGCNFKNGNTNFFYRLAKTTPKKTGLFVTLWKRDEFNITQPYHESDEIDFLIIECVQEFKRGIFIFSKKVLIENYILRTNKKEGKRGFRVYPEWVVTENKQAEKTQIWQNKYFINLGNEKDVIVQKLNQLLHNKY